MADEREFTEEEIQEIRDAFKAMDEDGSGKLDATELGKGLQLVGANPDRKEIEALIASADKDDDNKINEEEFIAIIKKNFPNMEEEEKSLREAFAKFDKDGNGSIEMNELKQALTNMGDKMTEEEVEEMFQQADKDDNGKISYEEFVKVMCPAANKENDNSTT